MDLSVNAKVDMIKKLSDINPDLAESGPMLIEFVQAMLANGKHQNHVRTQLEEILTAEEASAFSIWLFEYLGQSVAVEQTGRVTFDMDVDSDDTITASNQTSAVSTKSTTSARFPTSSRLLSMAFKQATASTQPSAVQSHANKSPLSNSTKMDARHSFESVDNHFDQIEHQKLNQTRLGSKRSSHTKSDVLSRLGSLDRAHKSNPKKELRSDRVAHRASEYLNAITGSGCNKKVGISKLDIQSRLGKDKTESNIQQAEFKVNKIIWDLPNENKSNSSDMVADSSDMDRDNNQFDKRSHTQSFYNSRDNMNNKSASLMQATHENHYMLSADRSRVVPIAQRKSVPFALADAANTRCKYFPTCGRGDTCAYFHPTQPCVWYPNCPDGPNCMFLHPAASTIDSALREGLSIARSGSISSTDNEMIANPHMCRFQDKCLRPNCRLAHPSPASIAATKTQCRNYPDCADPFCLFYHPIEPDLDASLVYGGEGIESRSGRTVLSSSVPAFGRKRSIVADGSHLPHPTGDTATTTAALKDSIPGAYTNNGNNLTRTSLGPNGVSKSMQPSTKLCWNGINCLNRSCRYSHTGPVLLGCKNVWRRPGLETTTSAVAKPAISQRQFALADAETERVVIGSDV
ncbi:hypothetical protein MT418_004091 [Batrachochytrium dendrobatidis]